jgi:hypothetical protein
MRTRGKASRAARRIPKSPPVTPDALPARLRWARVVVAAAFAAGLLLAPRLFLATRSYPRAPVLDGWPLLATPFDVVVLGALLAALCGVALAPGPRWWAAAAAALAVVLAVEDQSRWQPWFYQYVVMLAALAAARDSDDAIAAWRTVLVGLYLWGGIQKLNSTFMTHVFPWLVEPVTNVLPSALDGLLLGGWMVVPALEIAVAAGLLVPHLRRAAVVAAIATHVVVLGLLGPLGHGSNAVVWPWNAALAALVALLFWNGGNAAGLRVVTPRRLGAHAAALVLYLILPALSVAGRWDAYLSGALYSGNVKVGALSVTDDVAARLPESARRHVTRNQAGANVLDLWEWSMGEVGVPSYPEDRIFRAVARDVCRLAGDPADVALVVFGQPDTLTGQRAITRSDCAALARPGY